MYHDVHTGAAVMATRTMAVNDGVQGDNYDYNIVSINRSHSITEP